MKTGVLLVNLGTPDEPTPSAIRRFLREFLSDRRVVALPPVLWWPVLYGLILPFRPQELARKYRLIWTSEGSPLLAISRRQADRLAGILNARPGADVVVRLAMRYGNPSIASVLAELREQAQRLVVLPLYPQYSTTTTASVRDALEAAGSAAAAAHIIPHYHDDPGYILALAQSVQGHWAVQTRGDHLLMSFHGIPEQYVVAGDPYARQCRQTATLLAQALKLPTERWSVAFQSRLGKAPWIKPYTDVELPRLAQGGVRKLDVICPGFAADCLETLEEVAIRYAADFRLAGGEALRYIPALNDSYAHLSALADLLARELATSS